MNFDYIFNFRKDNFKDYELWDLNRSYNVVSKVLVVKQLVKCSYHILRLGGLVHACVLSGFHGVHLFATLWTVGCMDCRSQGISPGRIRREANWERHWTQLCKCCFEMWIRDPSGNFKKVVAHKNLEFRVRSGIKGISKDKASQKLLMKILFFLIHRWKT